MRFVLFFLFCYVRHATLTPKANEIIQNKGTVNNVGILNEGNFCYISSLIQCLYNIPIVKNAVYANHRNEINLNLATVFARLDSAQNDAPISIRYNLVKYLQEGISHDKGFTINDFAQNDSHELFLMLIQENPVLVDLFAVEDISQYFLGNDVINEVPKVNEVDFTIYIYEAFKRLTSLEAVENDLNNPSSKLFINLNENFLEEKLVEQIEEYTLENKTVSNEVFKISGISKLSPLLCIHINRQLYRFGEALTINNLDLNFPETANFQGKVYRLTSVIYHGNNHYVSRVKLSDGRILHFNDGNIPTQVDDFNYEEKRIHMVIYAKEERPLADDELIEEFEISEDILKKIAEQDEIETIERKNHEPNNLSALTSFLPSLHDTFSSVDKDSSKNSLPKRDEEMNFIFSPTNKKRQNASENEMDLFVPQDRGISSSFLNEDQRLFTDEYPESDSKWNENYLSESSKKDNLREPDYYDIDDPSKSDFYDIYIPDKVPFDTSGLFYGSFGSPAPPKKQESIPSPFRVSENELEETSPSMPKSRQDRALFAFNVFLYRKGTQDAEESIVDFKVPQKSKSKRPLTFE